jgi:hypothetical protein
MKNEQYLSNHYFFEVCEPNEVSILLKMQEDEKMKYRKKAINNTSYESEFADWLTNAQSRRDIIYRNKKISLALNIIIWVITISLAMWILGK